MEGREGRVLLKETVASVIAAALLLSAVLGDLAQADTAPPQPSATVSTDLSFGFGGATHFGVIDSTGVLGFAQAGHHLGDVDLWTGGVLPEHLGESSGYDIAATTELLESGQMALDFAEMMRRAEEEKARKRAEAEKRGAGLAFDRKTGVGYPKEWELKNFSTCGAKANANYKSRIEVVDAFEVMCQAAAADGVPLVISSAYRSVEHQARLWNQKLKETGGNAALARKWVAPPGKSNHNRGIAIDLRIISGDPKAKAWVHKIVGCYSSKGGLDMSRTKCNSGERPVKQVQLYGFILPMDWEPWHIELGVPIAPSPIEGTGGSVGASCNPDRGLSNPEIIAAVWKCRLADAGYSEKDIQRIVAEALVVAKCESGFVANAIWGGGKYVNKKHPKTGRYYTARGLFQFIRTSGDNWIAGGWENADDPVANSDAAVRYYIAERKAGREGWGPWECNKKLPQYGGPKLPDWAFRY